MCVLQQRETQTLTSHHSAWGDFVFAAAPVLNLSSNTKASIVYFRDLLKAKAGETVCVCVHV